MTTEEAKRAVRYWAVRLGEYGRYVDKAKRGEYIAIGWKELGNLDWLVKELDRGKALHQLTKLTKSVYSVSEISVGLSVGIVYKFVREIKSGDSIVQRQVRNNHLDTNRRRSNKR